MTISQKSARQKIAVIGSGISGLSAAWLLSHGHDVTLYEKDSRLGGHSHTIDAPSSGGAVPVDTGFIVYNELNYPNLVALFEHLGVRTRISNMGFAVSLDDGNTEYGGDNLFTLFSQWNNLIRPRFWSMLKDLVRFYREAPADAAALEADLTTLGDYLCRGGYGDAFQNDHLLPQAAAIWSASANEIRDFPASTFIRFCENHGLLKITDRPIWRTVDGGSREYVTRLSSRLNDHVRLVAVSKVARTPGGVDVWDCRGQCSTFDQVVIATHADQALAILDAPSAAERAALSCFRYGRNLAVLHSDAAQMPHRRRLWSAWNYVGRSATGQNHQLCVTYWMNRLQGLPSYAPLFLTLNPLKPPDPRKVIHTDIYEHPIFDAPAIKAQKTLWSLQGNGGVWWCGAYFGSGFHEDGLQAGLAVAEAVGGVKRPWTVLAESDRIHIDNSYASVKAPETVR